MKVISPWDMVESKVSNEIRRGKIQLTLKFSRVCIINDYCIKFFRIINDIALFINHFEH